MYNAQSVWDAGEVPAYHTAGEAPALPGAALPAGYADAFVEMDNFRTYRQQLTRLFSARKRFVLENFDLQETRKVVQKGKLRGCKKFFCCLTKSFSVFIWNYIEAALTLHRKQENQHTFLQQKPPVLKASEPQLTAF